MIESNLAPVVLFVYNRVDVLKKTIEALKKNILARESQLFIFSDGPKNYHDPKVNAVREYIKTIDGFNNITIFESSKNKGLANSIIDGVTQIVNQYGKVIVLEDDLVTSPYFLKFSNNSLDFYENDENVVCICGYNYSVVPPEEKTFFIKGADCLGWSTWKRGWDLFEKNGEKLLNGIKKREIEKEFDFNYSYPYLKMLECQIDGKVNSWAIRWLASAFLKNKLCLYPSKSLIDHIGSSADATNCSQNDIYEVEIDNCTSEFPKIEIKENGNMRQRWENHFRKYIYMDYRETIFDIGILKLEYSNKFYQITLLGFIKISFKKKLN